MIDVDEAEMDLVDSAAVVADSDVVTADINHHQVVSLLPLVSIITDCQLEN